MSTSSSSSVVVLDDAVADADTAMSPYYFAEDDALSWPAAERTQSTLGGQWPFRRLLDEHGVPKEYAPYLADGHAACTPPPDGGSFICVYADAFDAGMRVPLHGFHAALLRHYGLAPAQLAPNAWRYMAAFVLLCRDAGVDPTLSVFRHLFSLCTRRGDAAGWHHFKPSQSHHARRLFSAGKKMSTTRYRGWKSRFFFLQAPPDAPWPCPVRWGKPTRVAVRKQQPAGLTAAASAAVEKLLDKVGDSGGIDVAQFLCSRHSPPELKKEPAGMTMAEQTARKRKRRSTEPTVTGSARRARSAAGCGSFSGGESSATATFSRLAQMVEAELDDREQELARLNNELQATRDAHEAEVSKLREEACRLKEELHKARSEEQAVKTQHQRELVESRRLMRGMYRQLDDLAAAVHELLPDDDDKDDGAGGDVPPPAQ